MTARVRSDDYKAGILAGDRAVLARAITLVESTKAEHKALAQELLTELLPHAGDAQRVGITGVPGVGKSTFIEALGCNLTEEGHKVAVLAIDPTSTRSGGSILGDKTRMARLAADPNAFIRPSPTSGKLGGVNRMTRETMMLCETAGFDVVLVETVGAGQSETVVADMVDFFLVLMLPGAGDELQGIKKGVLELADMIAVNKVDAYDVKAKRALREYKSALHIMTPPDVAWKPPVLPVSGLKNTGLDTLWATIGEHRALTEKSGSRAAKRRDQQVRWMWAMIEDRLFSEFRAHPAVKQRLAELESAVAEGRELAPAAAAELLEAFLPNSGKGS